MDGILISYNDDCQNIIEMGGLKKANVKKDETKWYNTLAFIIMRNILMMEYWSNSIYSINCTIFKICED